jgi:hypothetical protein
MLGINENQLPLTVGILIFDQGDESEVKSKSSVSTPRKSNNENPLTTTKFIEPTAGRKPVEPKGTFAVLRSKGMRITNYKEEGTIS